MSEPDLTLHLRLDDDALEDLERALLRARATELAEVRRRNVRLSAGYGDATTREVMDDEGRAAQRRFDALTAALEALRDGRTTRQGPSTGGTTSPVDPLDT